MMLHQNMATFTTSLITLMALLAPSSVQASNLRGDLRDLAFTDTTASNSTVEGIVGGTVVSNKKKYPFFVRGSGCGATMVAEDVVLTAAHCKGAFPNTVTVGATKSGSSQNTWAAKTKVLSSMMVHPNFNSNTMEYDFMMFK